MVSISDVERSYAETLGNVARALRPPGRTATRFVSVKSSSVLRAPDADVNRRGGNAEHGSVRLRSSGE